MAGFSRVYDEQNKLVGVLCQICFETFEPVAAREGGMLATIDGDVYDVCCRCEALEFLALMIRWNC